MSKRRLQYPGEICRPHEKVVERIEVELFRPPYSPSVEFSAVQELARLIRPMEPVKAPRPGVIPGEVTPILVQEIKNKLYKNFPVDLSVARTDERLGLRDMGIVADAMTIISLTAGASFTYKLNHPSNDSTPGISGASETEFEIEELYVTNVAQAGAQAIIRVNWNPFVIRLKP